MVSDGKKRLRAFAERAVYLQGDAEQLPFPPEHFDVLLSINTLYFMEDLKATLQSWLNVLKPGGLLLLGLRSRESMEQLGLHKHGFRLYEANSLCTMLEHAGAKACQTYQIIEPEREIKGQAKPMLSFICKGLKAK
jgi:ubiquinone/menaquinone biosynthesis C-methylase UbiE